MIRGTVEQVMGNRVSGWIYSAAEDLHGQTLLAFVDDTCVGAGKVELFRADLAEAGLGHGKYGYHFPVSLGRPGDAGRLVVKLDGSDAVLKQAASRVVGAATTAPRQRPAGAAALPLPVLLWMRGRGWLSQSDYDFLRYFSQLGVYDRTLTATIERPDRVDVELRDPSVMASELLELMRLQDTVVTRTTVATVAEIAAVVGESRLQDGTPPVVALWARERGRMDVLEGSHLKGNAMSGLDDTGPPGVDYPLGPDRLLFLDTRCVYGNKSVIGASGIDVFTMTDG